MTGFLALMGFRSAHNECLLLIWKQERERRQAAYQSNQAGAAIAGQFDKRVMEVPANGDPGK